MGFSFRDARPDDLAALLELENLCFEQDRLSPRSFQWMIARAHASLAVAEAGGRVMGYALLLFHRGTSLARLYSIAIAPGARGHGLGKALLAEAERRARDHDCAYLRLEVRPDNHPAIGLYERVGYRRFACVDDYYEDHAQALRYEKRIVQRPLDAARAVPYYQQSTEFTCGPACLMMAMAGLQPGRPLTRREEVQLWREATTVFMTSGHGGCSPQGLALAAWRRGFRVRLQVSVEGPLFLSGVRSEGKREVMRLVHEAFCDELRESDVEQVPASRQDLPAQLAEGGLPLVLISSYQLTRTKAPHWVLVTGCDEDFVYLHDPDIDHSRHRQALDCQHMPVSHARFQRMRLFGGNKLRASVVLYPPGDPHTARRSDSSTSSAKGTER
ncbi:GNAT family N-acetyltransferase/peptidase C39 family protein [Pseudomonas tohonis]|uniref:GNAT family N-acetyltransferase/peptidase C39 family protein n=1 Tax=Pseudomonas tohonis TaxID=2725477 RepID=UPI0021DB04D8|nr:peptidase C39 family protein [Pseudomonas tohonis]UXY50646.1 peptidase C39 family protein [Pseudomonas tohonis]